MTNVENDNFIPCSLEQRRFHTTFLATEPLQRYQKPLDIRIKTPVFRRFLYQKFNEHIISTHLLQFLIIIYIHILIAFLDLYAKKNYLPIAIVNPMLKVQSRIPILIARVSGVDMSEAYE